MSSQDAVLTQKQGLVLTLGILYGTWRVSKTLYVRKYVLEYTLVYWNRSCAPENTVSIAWGVISVRQIPGDLQPSEHVWFCLRMAKAEI